MPVVGLGRPSDAGRPLAYLSGVDPAAASIVRDQHRVWGGLCSLLVTRSSRKNARSALYLAAWRAFSQPDMTTLPDGSYTRHSHLVRPRFDSAISNITGWYDNHPGWFQSAGEFFPSSLTCACGDDARDARREFLFPVIVREIEINPPLTLWCPD